jgi:hypothetical protein
MAIQLSVTVRNARLDTIESTIGTAPRLRIRTGGAPPNCAAARSGTVLADITLPSDWMNAAANGAKTLAGTWQDASADADGTAEHFEIMNSALSVCHMQGTCGDVGTEDMVVDNAVFATGQPFTVTAFQLTDGNA